MVLVNVSFGLWKLKYLQKKLKSWSVLFFFFSFCQIRVIFHIPVHPVFWVCWGCVPHILTVWARHMRVLAWTSGGPISVFLIFSCSLGLRTQLTPCPIPHHLASSHPNSTLFRNCSYYSSLLKCLSIFCFKVVTVKLSLMYVPRCLAWMGGLVLWPATCLMVSFVVVPR